MIKIRENWFVDEVNRVIMLHGVNLGGSSKVPSHPDGSTYRSEGFFETRSISFVGRPFPLDEAEKHYQRLRAWGFNCLRFLISWEAVEHGGPGIYDEEYLDYLYQVVKKAGDYDFHVFIDPHQDVWSRFSGGDGAPAWTLEAAGFDIRGFKSTGAAIVHQTHGDPFPKMIWPTNAYKLAAATMFTLFFAGNDFAPATKIEGISIQNYLQEHYLASVKQVAERLKEVDCVIGYDVFNEPQRGYVGIEDLRKRYGELEMGVFPTPWQSMQLGSGYPQSVEFLERNLFGTFVKKHVSLNDEKVSAWLPGKKCIWRENGVWDVDQSGHPVLLRPDHFYRVKERPASFVQDHLLPFTKKFAKMVHSVDQNALIFAESETEKPAPDYPDASLDKVVYAPHWYDGVTLIFKRFVPWLGSNLFTQTPVFGTRRVHQSYKEQLEEIKTQAEQKMGNVPVLFGEIGVPFDMENKKAYRTGNYSQQLKAMNRSMLPLEENLLNYTLWNYTADNCNEHGDRWNDEDLSIFSPDQQNGDQDIYSGGRALAAVIRPYPIKTAGIPLSIHFDYNTGSFTYRFISNPEQFAPTIIFIPTLHYPDDMQVSVSSGEITIDKLNQRLEFRPSESGIQTITIKRK